MYFMEGRASAAGQAAKRSTKAARKQDERAEPSPGASPPDSSPEGYFEERPSILGLLLVVFLTTLLIASLVISLFVAYVRQVGDPPGTRATAGTVTTVNATTPAATARSAATAATPAGARRQATRRITRRPRRPRTSSRSPRERLQPSTASKKPGRTASATKYTRQTKATPFWYDDRSKNVTAAAGAHASRARMGLAESPKNGTLEPMMMTTTARDAHPGTTQAKADLAGSPKSRRMTRTSNAGTSVLVGPTSPAVAGPNTPPQEPEEMGADAFNVDSSNGTSLGLPPQEPAEMDVDAFSVESPNGTSPGLSGTPSALYGRDVDGGLEVRPDNETATSQYRTLRSPFNESAIALPTDEN